MRFFVRIDFVCFEGRRCPQPADNPILCEPGTVQINPGQIVCEKCLAGSYADRTGMTHCIPCPPGMFCPSSEDSPMFCPTNRLFGQTKCSIDSNVG